MSSPPSSSCESGNPSPPRAAPARAASGPAAWPRRRCRDVFWLVVFLLHLVVVGGTLTLAGFNRFRQADRFKIDRFTTPRFAGAPEPAPPSPDFSVTKEVAQASELTETYWKYYGVAGTVGAVLACAWLATVAGRKDGGSVLMRAAVHSLTAYLAVVSVLCFWGKHLFWGVALAVGAALHFLYVMSVLDSTTLHYIIRKLTHSGFSSQFLTKQFRLPFTMLVLRKAVRMVWELPDVMRVAYAFVLVMLCWMAVWSFGVSGIVALHIPNGGQWWIILICSVSLFWTGAVLSNTVHVIVSGMVFLVLIHGGQASSSMPPRPLTKSLQYAISTSFGSICYGSLFTAAIRTLRWEIRGIRSKIGSNECLLCCVDFFFHIVETLVRFFNKYAYVQIAVNGQSFNRSARDAWELFQSTGVEALIAYDCSGAVLLMSTILGGLITGTCTGVWTYFSQREKAIMVGSTCMLVGMILVGLTVVVVESAVTSIYICYAEDPLLIQRWDPEFFEQMSEALHQRLQYRSSRARQILNSHLDHLPNASSL